MSRTKRVFRQSAAHFFYFLSSLLLFSQTALAVSWGPLDQEQTNYLITLQEKALEMKLSEERYWHLLLHYKKGLFGGLESEADGSGFFLSVEGRQNSEKELLEDI